VTRIHNATASNTALPHDSRPVFFGHIFLSFETIDQKWLSSPRSLEFCGHVYDGIKLSPGSSQLSPDEIQFIFMHSLGYKDDAAIFSSTSFPAWFSIVIPFTSVYVVAITAFVLRSQNNA
jgi:hypothetical protein